jgi:hypothetical protein
VKQFTSQRNYPAEALKIWGHFGRRNSSEAKLLIHRTERGPAGEIKAGAFYRCLMIAGDAFPQAGKTAMDASSVTSPCG